MHNKVSPTEASILKNVLIVAPLSLIGRAGTFLIYVVLANWFGDTAEMDFIYYYWGIAVFLIELLSAASAYSVLVPLLAEARAKGETEAQHCVQSIFSRVHHDNARTLLSFRRHLLCSLSTLFSQLQDLHLPPLSVSYAAFSSSRLSPRSAGCLRLS